jgi:hypothetical protein
MAAIGRTDMHWAFVEWSPEFESVHEVEVDADHKHKACAAKSEPTEVEVECDINLPELLRHTVSAETMQSVMRAARTFVFEYVPFGVGYTIQYIGEMR